jgi:phage tail-like protein
MTAYEVQLVWDGVVVRGLRAVGPLQSSVGVARFYEGGTGASHLVPGRPDTAPFTVEREVSDDLTLDTWARGPLLRKEVSLSLVSTTGGPTVSYKLHRCWVSAYSVTADVATGLAVESVSLAVEAWERVAPGPVQLADLLAGQLGGRVHKVRVGRLMGATVEETRERVDELLRSAQDSGAVLLLDEAEALFASRTEVQDAHDRYAPTPVDVLRSRLAQFTGPVLVVPPDPDGTA